MAGIFPPCECTEGMQKLKSNGIPDRHLKAWPLRWRPFLYARRFDGYRMAAMILAEVGDFTRFDSPDKLLAYAGMSPSTYQSGQLKNCYPHMEKRGSRYLRYALYNATKYVCHWDPAFADYLAKKRAEGKHYNVALSHAAKKLVRLIFAMEKSGMPYRLAA